MNLQKPGTFDRSKRERPRYRGPVGMPLPKQSSVGGSVTSFLVHLLIVLLLIGPWWATKVMEQKMGGGGPGPAGGGGGGNNGTGGEVKERTRFVQIVPPPPPKVQQPQLVVPPPVIKPPPPEEKKPDPPKATPEPEAKKDASQVTGTGGGTGHDGTAGSGPGTGGGVGSGDGTGRGSSNGPGTGGGAGRTYPPTVTNLAILPIPVPSKVRPYKLIAYFDVDEKGTTTLLRWNKSSDNGYNKKIEAMLNEVRFRPAVKFDGTPVRDTTWITAEAP
jgi:periplasmic protein TonB